VLVFPISAPLVTETESSMIIVPLVPASAVFVEFPVIFPVRSTMPHAPLKDTVFAAVSNTALPAPNCTTQAAAPASSLTALMTFCIAPVLPNVALFLVAVNDVPLPVMAYNGEPGFAARTHELVELKLEELALFAVTMTLYIVPLVRPEIIPPLAAPVIFIPVFLTSTADRFPAL